MCEPFHTVRWVGDIDGYLELLDQTRLPSEMVYLQCRTDQDVWDAIKQLCVRGAPAIGVAAAYGVCVGINDRRSVDEVCDFLATSRPTAVNLFWALERMRTAASRAVLRPGRGGGPPSSFSIDLISDLLAEARAIDDEDRSQCAAMGRHGADLLKDLPTRAGILTHCN